jgi:hypothetical protein
VSWKKLRVLGLQMHVGDPFRVEFRNIWYKRL